MRNGVLLVFLVVLALGGPALVAVADGASTPCARQTFLFSPYKYVVRYIDSASGQMGTEVTGQRTGVVAALPEGVDALTLAFAVGPCGAEKWGVPKDGQVDAATFIKANLPALDAAGISYIIATGGAGGTFTCADPQDFVRFVRRYHTAHMLGVDFDIENGQSRQSIDQLVAAAQAAQKVWPGMRFSFTLATFGSRDRITPDLGTTGLSVLESIHQHGFDSAIIDLMVMDYGHATMENCVLADTGRCAMGASAIAAVDDLHWRFHIPYDRIEATPMIGGNDTPDEVFSLADARLLAAYAHRVGLIGLHFWSLDRDRDCAHGDAARLCNNYGHAGTLGYTKVFAAPPAQL